MKIITQKQKQQLINNHIANFNKNEVENFKPVVKLFDCAGAATWLLSELDPETNIAFGLCDLGMGFPELGYVNLDELVQTLGWRLERDMYFTADKTVFEYWEETKAIT